jgi:hypothetical protein
MIFGGLLMAIATIGVAATSQQQHRTGRTPVDAGTIYAGPKGFDFRLTNVDGDPATPGWQPKLLVQLLDPQTGEPVQAPFLNRSLTWIGPDGRRYTLSTMGP